MNSEIGSRIWIRTPVVVVSAGAEQGGRRPNRPAVVTSWLQSLVLHLGHSTSWCDHDSERIPLPNCSSFSIICSVVLDSVASAEYPRARKPESRRTLT